MNIDVNHLLDANLMILHPWLNPREGGLTFWENLGKSKDVPNCLIWRENLTILFRFTSLPPPPAFTPLPSMASIEDDLN